MSGSSIVLPIVSGQPDFDPAQYREIIVDPSARMGRFRFLQDALDYVNGRAVAGFRAAEGGPRGTATSPWLISLLPGTYDFGTLQQTMPSYCAIRGAGKTSTIIQRTAIHTNRTINGVGGTPVYSDPVLDLAYSTNVRLSDLTVVHSGDPGGIDVASAGGSFPVAVDGLNATGLRFTNTRLEGVAAGYWDFTDDFKGGGAGPGYSTFSEPYFIYAYSSEFVAHRGMGASSLERNWLATGCSFICDTTGYTANVADTPTGFRAWEFVNGYFRGCYFLLKIGNTLGSGAGTSRWGALTIYDTNSTARVRLAGCQAHLRVDGDVNASGSPVNIAAIVLGGDSNKIFADGCQAHYETPIGGLTSCRAVAGIYAFQNNPSGTPEWNLAGIDVDDLGGTGGTARADLVLERVVSSSTVPKNISITGSRVSSIAYSSTALTANQMATLGVEPQTINRQSGTSTLAAGVAAATLPLPYPANVADYRVFYDAGVNESYYTTAKTNTGFTINSSNGASTATVAWEVRR